MTGARVTFAWTRVGGARWDLPDEFLARTKLALPETRRILKECDGLFTKTASSWTGWWTWA